MFDMMQEIQEDMGQTKLLAANAAATADQAMGSVKKIETIVAENNEIQQEMEEIKETLHANPPQAKKEACDSEFGEHELQVIVEGLKEAQDTSKGSCGRNGGWRKMYQNWHIYRPLQDWCDTVQKHGNKDWLSAPHKWVDDSLE